MRSIVGQQLSTRSAQAIYGRLIERFDGHPPTPEQIKALAKLQEEATAYEKGARDGEQVAEKIEAINHHRGLLSDYSFSAKDHRGTTPPEIVLRFTGKGRFTVAGKVEVDR